MWSALILSVALLAATAVPVEGAPEAAPGANTITLASRKVPRGSSYVPGLRKRALRPFNVPLIDFFLGTDLQ